MEQVCDVSFHMKFYLRLYANPIQSCRQLIASHIPALNTWV